MVDAVKGRGVPELLCWSYPQPSDNAPLAVHMDAAPTPFSPGKHLLRVGVQGRRLDVNERKAAPPSSSSTPQARPQSPDKLPLAKRALRMLVDNLRDGRQWVALVTYAGGSRVVLGPTGMRRAPRSTRRSSCARGGTAMSLYPASAMVGAMKTLSSHPGVARADLSDGDAEHRLTSLQADPRVHRAGSVKEGVTCTTPGRARGNRATRT